MIQWKLCLETLTFFHGLDLEESRQDLANIQLQQCFSFSLVVCVCLIGSVTFHVFKTHGHVCCYSTFEQNIRHSCIQHERIHTFKQAYWRHARYVYFILAWNPHETGKTSCVWLRTGILACCTSCFDTVCVVACIHTCIHSHCTLT